MNARAGLSGPRWANRLGFQIAFLLAVVLLPLALVSAVRSIALVQEAQARSEAALLGETTRAAAEERRIIQEAAGIAATLALAVRHHLADDAATCSDLMRSVIHTKTHFAFAGFVPSSGVIRCSSHSEPMDVSQDPLFDRIVDTRTPQIVLNRSPRLSDEPVLSLTAPVIDATGAYAGFVAVSIPFTSIRGGNGDEGAVALTIFSSDGNILMGPPDSTNLDEVLPSDRPLAALVSASPMSFAATDNGGNRRIYSVIPLIPNEVYALGSLRASADATGNPWISSIPVLVPALMWFASLIVALLAVDRLVIRNISTLRNAIRDFASGSRVVGKVAIERAPTELREIAASFDRMMDNVIHDEAELENMVRERDVLLREVHHRVKNNLQLIASFMNMQLRRVSSVELRDELRVVQDRVLSLASIHDELFRASGLREVPADEVLADIANHLARRVDELGHAYDVRTDLDPIRMTADQIVPLALLATEALNNAMRHAAVSSGGARRIDLSFKKGRDDEGILKIFNDVAKDKRVADDARGKGGLGEQLVSAFGRQLNGELQRGMEGSRYGVTIRFAIKPPHEEDALPVSGYPTRLA
ncbi:sensor histidine kinase [Defluviimonas sp. WL0002]|uniref:histidine kinase n=1 Tax=Albidovulum marisflavi TaxID=2984159 RepID=A0ABT2ZDG3_9RHOB|nr:sensor histidine kinase [Defluviimonas sp. WL0002]MCV2869103.1 sensor histidine kinase [Defluviimonas sp. WL0002]